MANFWDKLRSGWQVVWCVEVEGIPVLWTERGTGWPLPSRLSYQAADLVIDKSAEVGSLADRSTGLGAGLPLHFRLKDSTLSRYFSRSPTATTALSAAITATETTIAVDDTTGFDAAGIAWCGTEAFSYTGKTATSFTGVTRGVYGSRNLIHGVGCTSLVTDLPRYYRGRLVTLSAVLVTPDGSPDAVIDYENDAKIVWRGWCDTGPKRVAGGFEFAALALDRLLARPTATLGSGKVTGIGNLISVQPSFQFRLVWRAYNAANALVRHYDIAVSPFAALAAGAKLTTAEAHEAIQAGWATALAATTDQVGGAVAASTHFYDTLNIYKGTIGFKVQGFEYTENEVKAGSWGINATLKADAAIVKFTWSASVGNKTTIPWGKPDGGITVYMYPTLAAGQGFGLNWYHGGDPQVPGIDVAPQAATGLSVTLDDPTAVVPASGYVVANKVSYPYKAATYLADSVHLTGMSAPAALMGQDVEFRSGATGTYADLMRKMIASAGGVGASTFDTLGAGQGYAVPALGTRWDSFTDEDSFDLLASGPLVSLGSAGIGGHGGESLQDQFGGALALAQRAVVMREEGQTVTDACRLGLISTEPSGSGYGETLSNTDLVSSDESPITILDQAEVLTSIRATFLPSPGQDKPLVVNVFDGVEIAAIGGESLEVKLPSVGNKASAPEAVTAWATSLLAAARTLQAVDLHVPPWKTIVLGGLVKLDLNHPDLWDAVAGTTRYQGVGRVIGFRRSLLDASVFATVLLGNGQSGSLCPSIPVVSWTGPAATPVTITVDPVAAAMLLDAGATAVLQHTRPGFNAETSGGTVTVTVVVDGDGYATGVLTTTATALTLDLDAYSELTFPTLANGSDWQDTFSHVADSSKWG